MNATYSIDRPQTSRVRDPELSRLRLGLRIVGLGWALYFGLMLLNEWLTPPLWERHSTIGSLVMWGHGGREYLVMLCAINIPLGIFLALSARAPQENRMFIDFAVVTNGVHLVSMLCMAIAQPEHHTNLVGDVPAGLLPTLALGMLWWPVRSRAHIRKDGGAS